MARQQDRQKARAMKKKMLDEARAATPVPTMRVPLLGQKPERRSRLADRARLKVCAEHEQEGDGGRLPDLANEQCADRGDRDQKLDTDLPQAQRVERPAGACRSRPNL